MKSSRIVLLVLSVFLVVTAVRPLPRTVWSFRGLSERRRASRPNPRPSRRKRARPAVNPENEYHWTGPALQVGVEKRLAFGERWILGIEGKSSTARAVIPIPGGEVDAPNVAVHALVGLGYRYPARRR